MECHIPVNSQQDKIYLAGGVVGGFRMETYAKYEYKQDNNSKQYEDHSDFHTNSLMYSVQFRFGINDIGIYADYQPLLLFKEKRGHFLYPWSVGVSIAF